jgi:hypothetical protein
MDELHKYLKDLNPKETNDTQPLFYGAKYRCYLNKKVIGIHTWVDDPNIGASFQTETERGIVVAAPDYWELLPDSEQC